MQELLFEGGADSERRIQDLDGDVALKEGIACAAYGGEPSLSQKVAELELLS